VPLERDVTCLSIRQSVTPEVVSNQGVLLREQLEPRTPDHAVPVQLDVGNPRAHLDERGPSAAGRERHRNSC
jgi:hypothetical protein